jgi:hypothetical protein
MDGLPVTAVAAVAGAVAGALLAMPIVSPPDLTLILIAVGGVLVGAAVAIWFAGPRGRVIEDPMPWPAGQDRLARRETVQRSVDPAPPVETVRVVLPATEQPAPGQWWAKSSVARPPAGAAPAPGPRYRNPPTLGSYLDSARIVQCPACGQFRVDVTHTPDGFAFHCQANDHRWEWRPGTPWPSTVSASIQHRTS